MSTKGNPREPLWAEREISFLRENYTRVPVAGIAAQLGRSYESVRRKAARVGVQHQDWGEKFSPGEDDLLRERYVAAPMSEMVALLGRHPNSIRYRARMLGLLNEEQVRRAAIASRIRHDYFAQIDAPIKAYILGLLATDGHVSSTSNGIHLKVALKDIELAVLVRDEISPQSTVRTYTYPPLPGYTKQRRVAHFAVSSAQMKADLGSLGVTPRKTFTLRWPDLEPHLAAPFTLGCFDGDGHLQVGNQAWQWSWRLYSASEPFLDAAHGAIQRHTGLNLRKGTSKRGLHALRLNGGESVRVLDAWLHADAAGLARKRYSGSVAAPHTSRGQVSVQA